VEDLLIRNQHVTNQIGMVEEEEMLWPDFVVGDVAVVARHCDHHRQRISRNFEKKLEWKPRPGTGRKSVPGMRDPLESRDPHYRSIAQSLSRSFAQSLFRSIAAGCS
jgi:hypothetical protein